MKVKVILVFLFLALSTSLKADRKYVIYCGEEMYFTNTVDGQLYRGTFKKPNSNEDELYIVYTSNDDYHMLKISGSDDIITKSSEYNENDQQYHYKINTNE